MAVRIKSRGRKKMIQLMEKIFLGIGGYSAQVGINRGRQPYRKKDGTVSDLRWDNKEIIFFGLAKTGRNPIFSTRREVQEIRDVWKRAINRSLRGRGNTAAIKLGARLVSRKILNSYKEHMKRGQTTGGKPARAVSERVSKAKVYRATHGNDNYRTGADKSIARKDGYGVDTGQVWDAFKVDVKKLPKSG
jgi:hypothetical protein